MTTIKRSKGTRKSDFPVTTEVADGARFDYISNGGNFSITFEDLQRELGAGIRPEPVGGPLATPLLNVEGTVAEIRGLEAGPGICADVTADGAIEISHGFRFDHTGQPLCDQPRVRNPLIKSLRAGPNIQLTENANSVIIQATGTAAAASGRETVVPPESPFQSDVNRDSWAINNLSSLRNSTTTVTEVVIREDGLYRWAGKDQPGAAEYNAGKESGWVEIANLRPHAAATGLIYIARLGQDSNNGTSPDTAVFSLIRALRLALENDGRTIVSLDHYEIRPGTGGINSFNINGFTLDLPRVSYQGTVNLSADSTFISRRYSGNMTVETGLETTIRLRVREFRGFLNINNVLNRGVTTLSVDIDEVKNNPNFVYPEPSENLRIFGRIGSRVYGVPDFLPTLPIADRRIIEASPGSESYQLADPSVQTGNTYVFADNGAQMAGLVLRVLNAANDITFDADDVDLPGLSGAGIRENDYLVTAHDEGLIFLKVNSFTSGGDVEAATVQSISYASGESFTPPTTASNVRVGVLHAMPLSGGGGGGSAGTLRDIEPNLLETLGADFTHPALRRDISEIIYTLPDEAETDIAVRDVLIPNQRAIGPTLYPAPIFAGIITAVEKTSATTVKVTLDRSIFGWNTANILRNLYEVKTEEVTAVTYDNQAPYIITGGHARALKANQIPVYEPGRTDVIRSGRILRLKEDGLGFLVVNEAFATGKIPLANSAARGIPTDFDTGPYFFADGAIVNGRGVATREGIVNLSIHAGQECPNAEGDPVYLTFQGGSVDPFNWTCTTGSRSTAVVYGRILGGPFETFGANWTRRAWISLYRSRLI